MASFNLRTYNAPHSAEFTEDSARASLTYFFEPDADSPQPPTLDEVRDKIRELIGWTETGVSDDAPGRLTRHLPMAHPIYQNLVVVNCAVSAVEYEPEFSVAPADPEELMEAVPLPDALSWHSWRFDLTFAPRPYAMIRDDLITRVDDDWVDEDGNIRGQSYFREWDRYTVWKITPREEYIKARHGEMKFRTGSGALPDGAPYPAFPHIPLPDDVLTVTWYRVPYRYVRSADSILRRYRNYVNQDEWEGYPPGAVLYRGFKDTRVNPPFAELDPDWGGLGVFAVDPLVDIELEFWITRRVPTDPPTPANPNWIASGWNCFPNYHFGRRFFYTSSARGDADPNAVPPRAADPSLADPFFPSFPVQALFVDPDSGLFAP